jgi:hypothetical protein
LEPHIIPPAETAYMIRIKINCVPLLAGPFQQGKHANMAHLFGRKSLLGFFVAVKSGQRMLLQSQPVIEFPVLL